MGEIIVTSASELKRITKEATKEAFQEIQEKEFQKKLYTVNEVAKATGKHHATITKYVKRGIIKTNEAGLITHEALQKFLEAN